MRDILYRSKARLQAATPGVIARRVCGGRRHKLMASEAVETTLREDLIQPGGDSKHVLYVSNLPYHLHSATIQDMLDTEGLAYVRLLICRLACARGLLWPVQNALDAPEVPSALEVG